MTSYENSPVLETTRTYRAKIVNHQQLQDDLDQCGLSASKRCVHRAFRAVPRPSRWRDTDMSAYHRLQAEEEVMLLFTHVESLDGASSSVDCRNSE